MIKRFAPAAMLLASVLSVAPAFAQDPPSSVTPGTKQFRKSVVTSGLAGPWEMTWGPDNMLWVTERTGKRITRINPANGAKTVAITIPEVSAPGGQDGLLGMALHPDLLRNSGDRNSGNDYVYIGYTYVDEAKGGHADVPDPRSPYRFLYTKIVRLTYDKSTGTLSRPLDLITGMPAGNDHQSGRVKIGPDRKLYYTIGDQGNNQLGNFCRPVESQRLPTQQEISAKNYAAYVGKSLRLNLDGSIPSDNPKLNGVISHVYTFGHRNMQGIDFGPDGTLYASEHGPKTDDEVNILTAGSNYGWPNVAGYQDDRGYVYGNWSAAPSCSALTFNADAVPPEVPQQKESAWHDPDFAPPLRTFFTVENGYDFRARGGATIAPSGMKLYRGGANAIPGWANSLLLVALKAGRVYRLTLSADGTSIVGDAEEVFKTTNRYRDIAVVPDGRAIYLVTDPTGRTTDSAGASTTALENGGSILEFKYTEQR